MTENHLLDLDDCTEYRLALQVRPPAVVHGTLASLVALLGVALAWSAVTHANLVVRAQGRVRPVTTPRKVFAAGRGEMLSASAGGRVVEVNFRQGDRVARGAVLVRLGTDRLDNEIDKQRQTIRAAEEELARIDRLAGLLEGQAAATRSKSEAELAQARAEVHLAKEQRDVDVRLAEVALRSAKEEEAAFRRLVGLRASSSWELRKATTSAREAEGKLTRSRLPVNEDRVTVAHRALELARRDYEVKREELEQKRQARQVELRTARIELSNRELERAQAVIRSPIDGVVTAGDVKAGDLLEPGKSFAEVAEQAGFRFEASVPSEEVGRLRLGMPVRVKLDAYDYQRYGTVDGSVCFIAPDSGHPEGGRAGSFTVRIELRGDTVGRGPWRGHVRLGMAGQAEIVTGRESLLSLLRKSFRQSISLDQ
jgi:multidrug resistance efflux pump